MFAECPKHQIGPGGREKKWHKQSRQEVLLNVGGCWQTLERQCAQAPIHTAFGADLCTRGLPMRSMTPVPGVTALQRLCCCGTTQSDPQRQGKGWEILRVLARANSVSPCASPARARAPGKGTRLHSLPRCSWGSGSPAAPQGCADAPARSDAVWVQLGCGTASAITAESARHRRRPQTALDTLRGARLALPW